MKNEQQDFNGPIIGCTWGLNAVFLTIVFVVLKLFSAIEWSWWLVFCPLFVVIGLYSFIVFIVGLVVIFKANNENNDDDGDKGAPA